MLKIKSKTKSIVNLFVFLSLVILSLVVDANLTLLAPAEMLSSFKATTNENQRYQILNQLGSQIADVATASNVREYIAVFNQMAEYSKSLQDADWVYEQGLQLVHKVADFRTQSFITAEEAHVENFIPLSSNPQNEFIYYFNLSSEGLQHRYLAHTAIQEVIRKANPVYLEESFNFFHRIKNTLQQPEDYILRDLVNLEQSISFLICRQFRLVSYEALATWMQRMNTDGMQRLLQIFDNQIVTAKVADRAVIEKMTWISKNLFAILYSQYKEDPFNEWQFQKPLSVVSAIVSKSQRLNIEIKAADVQFLIEHLSPVAFTSFCENISIFVLEERATLTHEQALQIMPTYELLNAVIVSNQYEANTFRAAYGKIKKAFLLPSKIEGVYAVKHQHFTKMIIAYKNDSNMAVGIQTKAGYVNLLFDGLEYDNVNQLYVGSATQGFNQFILKLLPDEREGQVRVCLNEDCFVGILKTKLPEYLSLLNAETPGPEVEVNGVYKGQIKMRDGSLANGEILLSNLNGHLVGNFKYSNTGSLAFTEGIRTNSKGVVYLSAKVGVSSSLHLIHAELNEQGELRGEWFSTAHEQIGKFIFKKQNR